MARLIGRDGSLLSVGGTSVLADYTSATLNFSTTEYDVTAIEDTFMQRVPGISDWEVTVEKFITTTSVFPALVIANATVIVSGSFGGKTFIGTGMITSNANSLPFGGQTESITVRQAAGTSPSLS